VGLGAVSEITHFYGFQIPDFAPGSVEMEADVRNVILIVAFDLSIVGGIRWRSP